MRIPHAPVRALGLAACAVLLASCHHGATRPAPAGPWEEVAVVRAPDRGAFMGLAFTAGRGLIVGAGFSGPTYTPVYTPFAALLQTSGVWAPADGLPAPAGSFLTAAGIAPGGRFVAAGVAALPVPGFILEERDGWSRHDVPFGGLAFAASGDTLRFAGAAAGNGQIRASIYPDIRTTETLPFPTAVNEHGLHDIAAGNGVWAACGFDDGGDGSPEEPNSVLFRNAGSGWERLDVPCGGCSDREFDAVAVDANGVILLGGSITNFAGGAHDYTAFLLMRSVSGAWVEIALPQATALESVNDILLARNGDAYLACGQETASIVRWPSGRGLEREAAIDSARVWRMAEASDGTVWAVGTVQRGEIPDTRPALWKRSG